MAINVKDKLVTLESLGVAYSAEQDAREEADQALSTRIDNIVAPEGDPSLTEVSDARVSGSTTHNTLKARLDADKAAIETDISAINESLDAEVTTINDSINAVYEGVSIDADMFEKGSLGNSGGNDTYRQACRCRLINKHIYNVDVDFTIVDTPTQVTVMYYDNTGAMTSYISKTSGSYTIPAKSLFRLFIDGRRGQTAEEMTVAEILERVEFSVDSSGLNAIDASVKQLRTDVNNVQSQLGNVIPDYYFANDYLPSKAHTAQLNANDGNISFGFVTDMHMGDSSKNSMLLAKYIADRTSALPFVICGGDIPETNTGTLDGLYEQAQDWQKMMGQFGAHNVYTCRGNHDYLAKLTEGSTALTNRACHAYVMGYRPYNIHPSADGKNSYYFDVDTAKIRFIVLDQYDVSNTDMDATFTAYIGLSPQQYHWFVEEALNANGYDIVIICHQPLNIVGDTTYKSNLDLLRDIITAFNAHEQFTGSWGATSINVDFSTYTSNLICVFSGHTHYDASGDTGFLNIVSTSDAVYQTDGYSRQLGTITECALNIISINTSSKVIKCLRVGAGSDRTFSY